MKEQPDKEEWKPHGREKHPFCRMEVGDTHFFTENIGKMQAYSHTYGHARDKVFRTKRIDGGLFVKRVA